MLDGVCAVAADATSGQILWERTHWDDAEVEHLISGRCLAGTGQLCWDDEMDEVVFSGGDAPPVRLSPVDGACCVAYARGRIKELSTGWPRNWQTLKEFRGTYSNARGQDVGSLGPGWTVFGGRRLLTDQAESGTWRMNLHFLAQDENGDGRLPLLRASDCVLTPSWDDADVLFILQERRSATIALLPRSKLFAALRARSAAKAEGLEWILRVITLNRDDLARWRTELSYQVHPEGCVLTSDAALLLTNHRGSGQLTAWDRADGQQLWQVDLPSVPLRDGLAVAAEGRVVVTLRDGSVLCVSTNGQSAR
jgi:outer membrane protein assembly factor BamB